ncbi:hypothetical protein EGI11_03355 [Chryseobacterium sp. H3056]|uniref:Uncharacterized protein n=1 Tax=Kaistella daneshvariae TaxID=2487074 RepID=A0A3N0WXH7_9FLAO|nr:hypothetical protein [Kaistella daneshvariae]ROI09808.1 hypothetical protein EGI11_03355 [Kaistella daneshvariae]
MKIERDKILHFSTMLAALHTAHAFWNQPYWLALMAVVFALLWEFKDYKLIQKDFGIRANEVRYDVPDVLAFVAGVGIFLLTILITKP